VSDARLHFPFAIRIPDLVRESHHALVSENIAKQRVDGEIVDTGDGHGFFQVVENDDSWTTI